MSEDLYPSKGLVSSMYERAPSDGYATQEEIARRLQEWMQRLLKQYGPEEIQTRITRANGDPEIKATLLQALEREVARTRNLHHQGASS